MGRVWVGLLVCLGVAAGPCGALEFDWEALPQLPVALAGPSVGTLGENVLAAGGVTGARGEWSNAIYLLEDGASAWRKAGTLPEEVFHAAAVRVGTGEHESLWLIGGEDAAGPRAEVLALRLADGGAAVTKAGQMPVAMARPGAAVLGEKVYVAGMANGPAAFFARSTAPDAPWERLDSWPGGAQANLALVAQGDALFLMGSGEDGASMFFRYRPQGGWTALPAPPIPMPMACGAAYGQGHVLFFGETAGVAWHEITRTWTPFDAKSAPYAGAASWFNHAKPRIVLVGGAAGGSPTAEVHGMTARPRENRFGALDYGALLGYFVLLLAMGAYFSRRERDTDAFFLGSRRVPWWAVGISIFGTSISAITYLSIPAMAYATNWVYILGNVGTVAMAPIVVWWYLPHFRAEPIVTPYEYLERRFNVGVRIYGSLTFALFQFGRMSIVLLLPAITLSAATGLPVRYSVIAMGLLATAYTVLGGIEAVIWTDVVQTVVLLGGALGVLVMVGLGLGGDGEAPLTAAWVAGKFHTFTWSWDLTTASVGVVLIGNLFAMAYPSTADQTVVQRYLSTATERDAARAAYTNAWMTMPAALLFYSVGTGLWLHFRAHPGALDPTLPNDAILPLYVVQQFPAGLRGVLIAGVFAAAMSSLDSSMNSLAAVVVHDYYRRFRRGVTESGALRLARWLTLLFGLFGTASALYLAAHDTLSLLNEFLKLLGLVGGGLAGVMALGVFTRRANGMGALAGALASAAVLLYVRSHTPLHFFLHGMIGFLTAFGAGYLASLLWPRQVARLARE